MPSAQVRIGDELARSLAAFNLLGRLHMVRHAVRKARRPLTLAKGSGLLYRFADSGRDEISVDFDFHVPQTNAVEYLRNLTPVTRSVFDGLEAQYKHEAFTIAGTSDQRLIEQIRDELAATVATGGTAADFHTKVNALTDAAGVERLTSFSIDTAFNTSGLKAYSAGRLEQMQQPDLMEALPFWQYWTVGDLRVRPSHAVLDGFAARAIDPVWAKIYPPCGFNCRCSVLPALASDVPADSSEPGLPRLPLLAVLEIPQPGFRTLIAA